jgi:putative ABC transport system permease protein
MTAYALSNAVCIGAIFSLLALGIYLAFRVARFPDLTCDGTYALGACLSARLVTMGMPSLMTLSFAVIAGFAAGFFTGAMHTKLGYPAVVAGIITMTAAYSVNLLLMGGTPNVPVPVEDSLFAFFELTIREEPNSHLRSLALLGYPVVLLAASILIFCVVWRFLVSLAGLRWRATGIDEDVAQRNGINTYLVIPTMLGVANGLISLAGAIFAHYQRFADVNMGVGILIVGLASVFIGQALESWHRTSLIVELKTQLVWVLAGSLLYRILLSVAYTLGLPTSCVNLVTAGLVFIALLSPRARNTLTQAFTRT